MRCKVRGFYGIFMMYAFFGLESSFCFMQRAPVRTAQPWHTLGGTTSRLTSTPSTIPSTRRKRWRAPSSDSSREKSRHPVVTFKLSCQQHRGADLRTQLCCLAALRTKGCETEGRRSRSGWGLTRFCTSSTRAARSPRELGSLSLRKARWTHH